MPTTNDSASGSSHSTGNAVVTTLSPITITASGSSQSSGDATIALSLPLSGLTDFAIWDLNGVDPAISCLLMTTAGAPGGRASITAYAPTTYTTSLGILWNAAQYAAVRATWSTTGSDFTGITAAQIEPAPTGNLLPVDAADYRSKLVYDRNAIFGGGVTTYDATVSRSQDMPLSGAWSGKMVNNGGLTPYSMKPTTQAMAPTSPGQVVTGSVYLALPRAGAQWTAGLVFYDSSYNKIGTFSYTAYASHPGGYAYQPSTATATAPASSAYVAVVPFVTPAAISDGEIAYADCHRVSVVNLSTRLAPGTFQPARQQNITVKANRINQVYNPSFDNDVGLWYTQNGGTGSGLTYDSTVGRTKPGAAKLTALYTAGSTAPGMGTAGQPAAGMAFLQPGATYTLSAYIQPTAGIPPVYLFATAGSNFYYGNSTATTTVIDGDWYRLWVTFTVPLTSSGSASAWIYLQQSDWTSYAANATWWVDDVNCEQTPLLLSYFDGSEPSPDYMWEGTPYRSRSHYYRDFRSLQYRLNGLVATAMPLGVPYQISYAQPDS